MTALSENQKQLLFDYCLGLTSESEAAQAQELVFSNDEAAKLVASIKASLSPLESITPPSCPDELAEGTVWRAMQAARTGRLQLDQLLAAEQNRKTGFKTGFWRNMFGRLATAAVFVIVGSALLGGGSYARQKYWQTKCGSQLAGMFRSLGNYQADNAGLMPSLASEQPSTGWWKVGYQGPENASNTRRMWVLVKHNYAKPTDFMCPAPKCDCSFTCNPKEYNDFPSRKLVTYSFRINCPKGSSEKGRQVIVADMSPVFETLPSPDAPINISDELLHRNSANHSGSGQNVLFCDGSVQFVKSRQVGPSLDDIFTIQNTSSYQGTETPASEADAFLAP